MGIRREVEVRTMPFQQMSPFGSPGPSVGGINQMALMDARQRASNMEMRVLGSEAMAVELAKAKLDYRKEMQRERTRLTMREMDQAFGNKNREQRAYEMKWYGDQLAKYRELAVSDSKEARASAANLYREIAGNMTASVKEMMAPFALAAGKPDAVTNIGVGDSWQPPDDQSGIGEPAGTTAAPAPTTEGPATTPTPSPATSTPISAQEFAQRAAQAYVGEQKLSADKAQGLLGNLGWGQLESKQGLDQDIATLERFYQWLQHRVAGGWYKDLELQYAKQTLTLLGKKLTDAYLRNPELLFYATLKGAFSSMTPDLERRAAFDDRTTEDWEPAYYNNSARSGGSPYANKRRKWAVPQ
jgi:hypothetical protein